MVLFWCLLSLAVLLLAWKGFLMFWMRKHGEVGTLVGKTVVITGATDGIGKFALLELIKKGPKMIIFCGRDLKKAVTVLQECTKVLYDAIEHAPIDTLQRMHMEHTLKELKNGKWIEDQKCFQSGSLCFKQADLSDLDSVEEFAQFLSTHLDRIDILVANAGGLYAQKLLSKQNVEMTVASNFLGHFHLVNLVMPLLRRPKETPNQQSSRIIGLSSCMHWMTLWLPQEVKIDPQDIQRNKITPYDYWYQYSTAKLMINLMTKGLVLYKAKHHAEEPFPRSFCLFPGIILTAFNRGLPKLLYHLTECFRALGPILGNTVSQGAQTMLKLVLANDAYLVDGGYYSNCKLSTENPCVHDQNLVKSFWNESLSLLEARGRTPKLLKL